MLQRVMPAVVNISTTGRVQPRDGTLLSDPFFRKFFGLPEQARKKKTQSLGSGVIVDANNGYILTNHHLLETADEITVRLQDRRRLRARLVGADPEADVAVIQIPSERLTAVSLADSDRLQVGDFVVAIGNPFGLGQTATSGIISALGRSGLGIEGYEDFIQTDASINPGNSGGALVNLRGELVGLNTAILAPSGGNVGIGFAIPANMAKAIMDQLIEYGEVRRGYLGIEVQDLNPRLAEAFGIESGQGAVITQVRPGSSAAKAGLQPGNIIVAINDRPVDSASAMRNAIGLIPAGQTVTLDIVHRTQPRRVALAIAAPRLIKIDGEDIHAHFKGAVLSPIDPNSPLYEGVGGILVLEIDPYSTASGIGLREDDIIRAINRQPVGSLEELQAALQDQSELLINIQRGNRSLLVLLR